MSILRHLVVGASVVGTGVLGAAGVLANPQAPERFDQWQTTVSPDGDGGLRVREIIDQDFGSYERRGLRRDIPNDFGVLTGVTASSATAPDDLLVSPVGTDTDIRVGDPNQTVTGRHRYEIAYTYPTADLDDDSFTLDVIGGLDFETGRFDVVVTGFELAEPRCFTGGFGSTNECEIVDGGDGTYRVTVEPLPAGAGITVEGDIVAMTDPTDVAPLPLPERRPARHDLLIGLALAVLAAASSVPVFFWARRAGRNEVAGSGAADAAYGELTAPGGYRGPLVSRLVTDAQLADMATIEFVPPAGIEPWEGSVLLRERLDDRTVQAYISGLAAVGAIELAEHGDDLAISSGPNRAAAAGRDREFVDTILGLGDPYVTGEYDKAFATEWRSIKSDLDSRIKARNWWSDGRPTASGFSFSGAVLIYPIIAFVFFGFSGFGAIAFGFLRTWPFGILFALAVPALVAFIAYSHLLPSRTATGSALALRAESFRRFLRASEARHVEWAWDQGLLREYSAWAVALGEATAWSHALAGANVPEPARLAAGPMIIHTHGGSFRSSTTAPSSSGGSGGSFGGGGFSGGSVGGGGGGGGGGSW